MNLIATLILVLTIYFVLTKLGSKLKIPSVVSLIVAGLLLGLPVVSDIIIQPNENIIFALGDIGLLLLMFLAGLESSWKALFRERKDAFFIAIYAAVFPFFLGALVTFLLGYSFLVSAIVGVAMSITAEATKAKVLLDIKKLKSKVGSAMIEAGLIDDVMGLSLFAAITYFLGKFVAKDDIFLAGAIIAFIFGLMVRRSMGRHHPHVKDFEKYVTILIVPFFFIAMGINFSISSLFVNPGLVIILVSVAVIGKLGGTLMSKKHTSFNWKQLHLIGWAMNSRGAIELALALLAFKAGLIPIEIYSTLVTIALITTITFPLIITRTVRKNPNIME